MADSFKAFAEKYDRFYGPMGEYDPVEVAFFKRLFDRYNVNRALDCACGTGKHLSLIHI